MVAARLTAAKPYLLTSILTFIRVWLACQWLNAGLHKITDPAWMDGTGRGLAAFWKAALATNAHGGSIITYDWYRAFIQFLVDSHAETWFAKLIAMGESSVGLGLLLGALVPMAALGGLTMNMSYMLAGSAGVNPLLALLAGVVFVGRRYSGVVGFDGLRDVVVRRMRSVHVRSRTRGITSLANSW
jgi:thiosulfate dehydrogenase (quinone) large subunit